MKLYKSLILGVSAALMTACHPALFEDIDKAEIVVNGTENVSAKGNIITVKKGTPLNFGLNGDPDFITFFSGEPGHLYAYRDVSRLDAKEVESMKLSFKVWIEYGKNYANNAKGLLNLKYALGEDEASTFPGLLKNDFEKDSVLVESFAWKDLIEPDKLAPESALGKIDQAVKHEVNIPADWFDKKFTLAFVRNPQKQLIGKEYTNGKGETETALESTFHIAEMKLSAKMKDGSTKETFASSFCFTPLNMTNKTKFEDLEDNKFDLPADLEYGSTKGQVSGFCNMTAIANGNLDIRGCGINGKWRYTWVVSDYIDFLSRPFRDTGMKVKEVSQAVSDFTYTYDKVGTYKATFMMVNENYDDAQSKLQEFVVNVVE